MNKNSRKREKMKLYIFRHGLAIEREDWHQDDALRPLTPHGVKKTRQVCRALQPVIAAEVMLTSPWVRARATAEIAAAAWRLPLRDADWLAAGHLSMATVSAELMALDAASVVVVGHEPGLGELLGALIGTPPIPLKKAGLALLEGELRAGGMRLHGLLTPKLAVAWAKA